MSSGEEVRVDEIHLQSDGVVPESGLDEPAISVSPGVRVEVTITPHTSEKVNEDEPKTEPNRDENDDLPSASISGKHEEKSMGVKPETGLKNGDLALQSAVDTNADEGTDKESKMTFNGYEPGMEPDITTNRSEGVRLKINEDKNQLTGMPAITVLELLEETVEKYPNVPALKVERNGEWVTWTFKQYRDDIRATAKAFIKLGLQPYNSVGIIGFNSPEWFLADIGAIYAGGMACGIYTTNSPEACMFQILDAQVEIVVAENQSYADKIIQNWDKLPCLKAIILYSGEVKEKGQKVYSWNEMIEIGRQEPNDTLLERVKSIVPNKCCTLIYTSGTTGNPKGVMFSHDNVVFGTRHVVKALGNNIQFGGVENIISYLPLSHIAAQLIDIYCPIVCAGTVWFARPDALKGSLVDTLRAVRPTLFFGVPRVYEKMEESLKAAGRNVTGIKRKIADWAKSIALRGNMNKEQGRSVPYGWTIASNVILKKVKHVIGLDRCKMSVVGAAPVQLETLRYFQSLNVPLFELYGMSECGCATLSVPRGIRTSSVGRANPGVEVGIINQDEDGTGEVCMRGRPVFMGYLNNPEKTKEALDDEGWLHSGDVGKIDEDGFVYITGRIKELIITAGGENIAPVPIEDEIKVQLPIISNAMVVGDKKKFLSVLLTLKTEQDIESGAPQDKLLPVVSSFCNSLNIKATKASELTAEVPEALRDAIQKGIDKANEKAPSRAARVQKWKLLDRDFSITGGELGPTLKIRRPHVSKMYKDVIEAFYQD